VSTDLREAMREAVTDAPAYAVDADAVIEAGARRIRRRNRIVVGASALAVAAVAVTAAVTTDPQRSEREPEPADVVRLDLDEAVGLRPEIVASTRTTWRDAGRNSLEYDRYVGITADGLVLHSRNTNDHGFPELGLLDPRTGETDWLPDSPAPMYEIVPLDLTSDRLLLFQAEGNGHALSVFDRATRTWRRNVVRLPYGIEVHVQPRAILGPDDRVYVGSTMEGESGPIHWWSAAAPGGGNARPEPALEGTTVAWGDGIRVSADPSGRVVVSGPAGDRVVSGSRPDGCERPEEFPDAPVTVVVAGSRPVVTYSCESGTDDLGLSHTVVYEQEGQQQLDIAGASVLTADDRHLALAGSGSLDAVAGAEHPGTSSTYLLDLDSRAISRVGQGPHEVQVALSAGLFLWNIPGPIDDNDVYDVVWKVARLQ
jgi:hypothetical protein